MIKVISAIILLLTLNARAVEVGDAKINCDEEYQKLKRITVDEFCIPNENNGLWKKCLKVSRSSSNNDRICSNLIDDYSELSEFKLIFMDFVKSAYPNKENGFETAVVKDIFEFFDKNFSENAGQEFFYKMESVIDSEGFGSTKLIDIYNTTTNIMDDFQ